MADHDKFLWLTLILLFFPRFALMAEPDMDDFVDPFDMFNFDPVNMRMKNNHVNPDQNTRETENFDTKTETKAEWKGDIKGKSEACSLCTTNEYEGCEKIKTSLDGSTTLLRQYAMTLTQHMESKVSSKSAPTDLNLRVKVTYHSLAVLRRFGLGEHTNFHSLHEILSSLVQFAEHVKSESTVEKFYWLEEWIGLSWPMMLLITLLIISASLLVYTVSHLRWTKALVFQLLLLIFLVSVIFNMIEMYQAKVADQEKLLRKRYEEYCPSAKDMTWLQWFTAQNPFSFEKDKCTEYMRAMRINPFFSASPIEAVALAVVKTFMTPMGHIGRGIKDLLEGLLDGLPVQFQFFVLAVLFIITVYIPTLLMDYRFSFGYGLINIGPQRCQNNYIEHVQPDQVQPHERMIDQGPERLPTHMEQHITRRIRVSDESSDNSRSSVVVGGRAKRSEILSSPVVPDFGNVEGAQVSSVPVEPHIGFEALQRKTSVTKETNADINNSDRDEYTAGNRDSTSCNDTKFLIADKNVSVDYLAGGDNTLVGCGHKSANSVVQEAQSTSSQEVRFQDTAERKPDKLCKKMAEISLDSKQTNTVLTLGNNWTLDKVEKECKSGKPSTDCVSKQMDKLTLHAEKEIDSTSASDVAAQLDDTSYSLK